MANKQVRVTTASIVTGDTLVSYNVYTDKPVARTLVGTMTPAEATAGKSLAFANSLNHNVTVYPVGNITGEFNSPSNIVVVDLTVTEYKVITSSAPNNNRILRTGGIDMLHTTSWSIAVWAKSLEAINLSRTMLFGVNLVYAERISNGGIRFRQGALTAWSPTKVDIVGGVIQVQDTNDGLEHKYEFIWTLGSGNIRLKIDDIDFGLADINPAAPTTTTVLRNLGADSALHAWEFSRLIINNNGTIHTWDMNEGSGNTITSNTAEVFDITTANSGGQTYIDANVWAPK